MSDERPTNIPYFSTTKRDGAEVPIIQTVVSAALWSLPFLVLVPLIAFGLHRWGGLSLDLSFYVYMGILSALIAFVLVSLVEWPRRRDEFMYIVEHAMIPGDANANGIPDTLEDLANMLTQDSNGDGVPDFMDILNRYNGGASTLYVTVSDASGDHKQYDELPYAERLPELARGIDPNKPLTYRAWGFGKQNGCLFEPPEWAKLTAALQAQGYAEKQNPNVPNSSIILTEKGRAWREAMVEQGHRIEEETGRRQAARFGNFPQQPMNPSPTAAD